MMKPRVLAISLLVFTAAALRLLPHWPNFTPIVPLALFAGAHLDDRRLAFMVPFAALLLSDFFLGFYPGLPFVYGGFALNVLIGIIIGQHRTLGHVAGGTLIGALSFFLVSNFGAWWTTAMYPQTVSGLFEAYVAGLPFLRNALGGDIVYVILLFGGVWLAEKRFAWLRAPGMSWNSVGNMPGKP